MTLKYDLRKKKCSLTENKYRYYAQVVKQGDFSFEELVKMIARRSAVSAGDVVGVMRSFVDVAAEQLGEGKRVHVSCLGSFMPRITSQPLDDVTQTRQLKIRTKAVQFTPSKYLQDALDHTPIEHVRLPFRSAGSHEADDATLKALLVSVLQREGMITRPQYGKLTGRLRYKAQQDLNRFVAQGWLEKCGKKPLIYYRLTQG